MQTDVEYWRRGGNGVMYRQVKVQETLDVHVPKGATDGHKYVNGILDKLAPRLRKAEVGAARKGR